MVIGPIPSNGTSPGLPLTLDNSSCTPTPNPTISTPSNAGDVEDGSATTHPTQHSHHSQQHHHQQQEHHHHHQQHSSGESPNDQSSLIILQPSEISSGTIAGIGGYSSMLPSFSHYAPGKFHTKKRKKHSNYLLVTVFDTNKRQNLLLPKFLLRALFFFRFFSFFVTRVNFEALVCVSG